MTKVRQIESLAKRIVNFSADYDYYDYCDSCDTREEAIENAIHSLWNEEEKRGMLGWLLDIIEEGKEEYVKTARELYEEVKEL